MILYTTYYTSNAPCRQRATIWGTRPWREVGHLQLLSVLPHISRQKNSQSPVIF